MEKAAGREDGTRRRRVEKGEENCTGWRNKDGRGPDIAGSRTESCYEVLPTHEFPHAYTLVLSPVRPSGER